MKNIHVLPTDKPSRLFEIIQFNLSFDKENYFSEEYKKLHKYKNKNLYITSDEFIEEGDFALNLNTKTIVQYDGIKGLNSNYKKIILTTDEQLIKDGVQAIDDEFLEWFVKNPSCESVEVQKWFDGLDFLEYKIIIPKEEPKLVKQPCIQCDGIGETTFSGTYNSQRKCDLCNGKGYIDSKDISQMQSDLELIQSLQKPKQETIEEVVNNFKKTDVYINEIKQEQDKKLYSEEDLDMFRKFMIQEQNFSKSCLDVFIEQFKKK